MSAAEFPTPAATPEPGTLSDAEIGALVRRHVGALRRMAAGGVKSIADAQDLALLYACGEVLVGVLARNEPGFCEAQVVMRSSEASAENWRISISREVPTVSAGSSVH